MDQYEELELIGKGTYGKVYKVRSCADDEIYVVKKVQFDGTPQSEAEAALREGQVLSLLRHPHVVPYKEFFKHPDGDLCLVMAYCEGGDLFRHIRELRRHGRTVPEPQVWQWLVQLLLSLSYIHAKRILHRDVKTQNIFLSEGKVLLGDFGLAKQLQRTFEMARTPIGTPYYMAPEIYEEQPYSFKSDVWALGCVMYEMMTGRAAFAADNLSKVVLRVIRGQYDPLPESYSSTLRTVVTSMLCKEVAARPDANTLLTVPAVVPHVQSYLESLTAEGPAGWATWRMKLPLAAMVQMSEALEAAGAALPGRSSQPPSNRTSLSGAAAPPAPPPAPAPPQPSLPEPPAEAPSPPSPPPALVKPPSPRPVLERPPSASRTPGLRPASPLDGGGGAAVGNGGGAGRSSQVVRLPPLPGAKLPPLRTPYGLATPFMGGALQSPQPQYAELQVIANQMLAIRTSQSGSGAPPPQPPPVLGGGAAQRPLSGGAGARPVSGGGGVRPLSGGAAAVAQRPDSAGRPGSRPTSSGAAAAAAGGSPLARPDSAGRRAVGSRPDSAGGGAAAAAGFRSPRGSFIAAGGGGLLGSPLGRPGSGGSAAALLTLAPPPAAAAAAEVSEEVRALDRTLIKTLEIARKAAAEADAAAPSPRNRGGSGGSGGGGIDEAALSAALPQGGFGFGGGGGGFGGGGGGVTHAAVTPHAASTPSPLDLRRETSSSDIALPPIHPRRLPSANPSSRSPATPSAAAAWASQPPPHHHHHHQHPHEALSPQSHLQPHPPPSPGHGLGNGRSPSSRRFSLMLEAQAQGHSHAHPHQAWAADAPPPSPGGGGGGRITSNGGGCGRASAYGDLYGPAVAVHQPGRTASYEEVDEGFVSLSGVTLHAASLSARRANLQRYCEERLGGELAAQVMQAVAAAQRAARGPAGGYDVDAGEALLRRQLDALLGLPTGQLRSELGPLIEELAFLHC